MIYFQNSEFTLRETLNYFGHIFGMTSSKIMERTDFLIEFLDLPKSKRLIRELSGGQQRRYDIMINSVSYKFC